MDEPDICNRRRDQRLHGRHAEAADGAGRDQGPEALGLGGPEAGHEQADRRDQVDRPLADLDGQGVADQAAARDGGDHGAVAAEGEALERHIELLRQGHERRGEKRADGCKIMTDIVSQLMLERKTKTSMEGEFGIPPTQPQP